MAASAQPIDTASTVLLTYQTVLLGGALRERPSGSIPPDSSAAVESLASAAAARPAEQAVVLASRDDLGEAAIAILAGRPEAKVVQALAANNRVRLNRMILRALIERGRDDAKLARFLLGREDLHLCHLRLFLHADSEQRGHLIAMARRSRLARIGHGALRHEFDAGKLARLELAALQRDAGAFEQLLAHALCCDLAMAMRITRDKSGEALALTMVALGLPVETVARMLLAGFPELCASPAHFRALINIVGHTPRAAAEHIVQAIIRDRAAAAG